MPRYCSSMTCEKKWWWEGNTERTGLHKKRERVIWAPGVTVGVKRLVTSPLIESSQRHHSCARVHTVYRPWSSDGSITVGTQEASLTDGELVQGVRNTCWRTQAGGKQRENDRLGATQHFPVEMVERNMRLKKKQARCNATQFLDRTVLHRRRCSRHVERGGIDKDEGEGFYGRVEHRAWKGEAVIVGESVLGLDKRHLEWRRDEGEDARGTCW